MNAKVQPTAFIFDLNGTMIDDMEFHIDAWHDILNHRLGANLLRDQVKKEMYGKNSEVLERVFGKEKFSDVEIETISIDKERMYQQAFKPKLALISGLDAFLKNAHAHQMAMAIGSAAIPFNIDFVIDNLDIRNYFGAIVSAEDVTRSKPDPETYIKAAKILNRLPAECVVFEDAPKGVEAATRAGMPSVVITTMHTVEEFNDSKGILMFIKDYHDERLQSLIKSA